MRSISKIGFVFITAVFLLAGLGRGMMKAEQVRAADLPEGACDPDTSVSCADEPDNPNCCHGKYWDKKETCDASKIRAGGSYGCKANYACVFGDGQVAFDKLPCQRLESNECIPSSKAEDSLKRGCDGNDDSGMCKESKKTGVKYQGYTMEYYYGCKFDLANPSLKSACISEGGCTEMQDFDTYDPDRYYDKTGELFECPSGMRPDLKSKDDHSTYVVINPDQCDAISPKPKAGDKIEWKQDAYEYKGTRIKDVEAMLKSQCIGPLADGCKGKSWWQKTLTSTFGNIILTILSVVFGVFYLLFGLLLSLILAILGWVLGAFDVSAVEALNTFWAYLRDLSNLVFIIILLYIAFATVLRLNVGQLKKMLPGFFIGAILINFSKQIALIIVDVGDFLTRVFLKMLPQDWSSSWGLASAIGEAAGVTKWFSAELRWNKDFKDMAPILGGILFGMLFQFIFLLVMGLATLLLVLRIVILWFLIVLSPLPYVAMAAGLKGWTRKWWDTFLKAVFFAPAMIFCLVLAVVLLTGTGSLGFKPGTELESEFQRVNTELGQKVAEAAPSGAANMEGFMKLMFASMFVIFGLMAAKMGSNVATRGLIGGVEKLMNKGKQLAWKGTRKIGKATAWPAREGAGAATAGLRGAWREKVTKRAPLKYAEVQAKRAKEVGEMEAKLKNLDTERLKKISRGKFGVERVRYTPEQRQRLRAAANHLLAERNQLPDYDALGQQEDIKKYITRLERWGGSRDKILENRPDWAAVFADNLSDPVQRREKIREVLDKKSPQEMWRKVSHHALKNEDIQAMLSFNDYQNIVQDKKINKKRKRELLSAIGNNLHKIKNVNRPTALKIAGDILKRAGYSFQNVRTVNYDATRGEVVISFVDAAGNPADCPLSALLA